MKKILIALDYGPSAQLIAETAYALSKSLNASVTLMHVIKEPSYYNVPFSLMGYDSFYLADMQDNTSHARKQVKEFLDAIVLHLDDSRIKTVIANGNVSDSILSYSKKEHVGLIVMGSHVQKGIDRLFAPDTAVDVLKNSMIPLLTIPVKV